MYSELEYSVFLAPSESVPGRGAVMSWCVAMARAVSAISVRNERDMLKMYGRICFILDRFVGNVYL